MRLLCCDPSSITGYAHGDPFKADPPWAGAHQLPKNVPITKRLIAIERFAIELIRGNGITDVYIEKPIMPRQTSFDAVASIAGYAFMFGVAATKCGCYCALVDMQSWRSGLGLPTQGPKNALSDPHYAAKFGHSKGGGLKEAKRQWVKDRAMEFAVKMGSDPKDDNEGDAICIWHYVARLKREKVEAPKYDLFGDLTV